MSNPTALCWFRRDLRLDDSAALFHALAENDRVVCAFVFDKDILAGLPADDRRVAFIHATVAGLKTRLQALGSDLVIRHGHPEHVIPALAREHGARRVYAANDYEPDARGRDEMVACKLALHDIEWCGVKDQVLFERSEVLNKQGLPYTVFTPYKQAWLQRLRECGPPQPYPFDPARLAPLAPEPMPGLETLGFASTPLQIEAGADGAEALLHTFLPRLRHYHEWRNYPAVRGVSYLSVHLRFGTISIRRLVEHALAEESEGAATWLSELIWREFYQQLLWHYPHVAWESFKPDYAHLVFPGDDALFEAWCEGRTGYPLVDAAMRQLLHSGYMHNRLRMLVASFLVKDLLIDWRRGEAWFARHLLDFDLAANNGGWQWAASTGCDAQPWFRIFNPVTQSRKFDPDGHFIRRYVPELAAFGNKDIHAPWLAKQPPLGFRPGLDYPDPVVDHAVQREKALALFGRKDG